MEFINTLHYSSIVDWGGSVSFLLMDSFRGRMMTRHRQKSKNSACVLGYSLVEQLMQVLPFETTVLAVSYNGYRELTMSAREAYVRGLHGPLFGRTPTSAGACRGPRHRRWRFHSFCDVLPCMLCERDSLPAAVAYSQHVETI